MAGEISGFLQFMTWCGNRPIYPPFSETLHMAVVYMCSTIRSPRPVWPQKDARPLWPT